MQILVKNIKLEYDADFDTAVAAALKKRGIKGVKQYKVFKKSLDARKKPQIFFVYTLLCEAQSYPENDGDIEEFLPASFPDDIKPVRKFTHSPVVVGFGPCGMFCALL
ncbi:MAG: hypothetical protein IJO52_03835, partial [Clostridia bacterium]|nr:hypothetical protein [Clostridia bacterium]